MKIAIIVAVIAIVIMCEIVSGRQRAETDNKIDEIHGWLRRQHPYKYTTFTDGDNKEIKNNDK